MSYEQFKIGRKCSTTFCFKKGFKMCCIYFFKCCSKFSVYSNLFEQTYFKNSDSLLKNPIISKRTVTKHFVPTMHFIIIIIIIIIMIIIIKNNNRQS